MDTIKNILIDSLNGFSAKDIPLFIFQILVASTLAHLTQIVINKKWKEGVICNSALIAVTIAILTSVVKYSLPFAIMGLAVVLLFKKNKEEPFISKLALLIVGVIGVGCGIGSVIQTIVGVVFILLIVLFTPLKK
tara:strand:+ start:61 stop:465 length:405 start_codon:yes stop_codon:yes gene_type:complete